MNDCGCNKLESDPTMADCGCSRICSDSGQFVDITGLCDLTTIQSLATAPYWTQISIPTVFNIPEEKPDMEELNSENVTVQIIRQQVIVTPSGAGLTPATNLEGRIETGRKLVIEGLICKSITYTALEPQQSIHSAHISVPFSAYITLPVTITIGGTAVPTLSLNFRIISCVEDVFIKEICPRQIFQNITLFLQAVPAPGGNCNEPGCDSFDNVLIRGVASQADLQAITLGADPNNMWTQIVISENLEIPDAKPNIEQINSLFSRIDIISQRVVRTAARTDPNWEGTSLTGRKLIIEGVLRQKISYTADVPDGSQPLHSAHFDIPFSAFIVITPSTLGSTVFRIQAMIEDIFICAVDERHIFKNAIIFIKATPCV